jgi:hypothetical protein
MLTAKPCSETLDSSPYIPNFVVRLTLPNLPLGTSSPSVRHPLSPLVPFLLPPPTSLGTASKPTPFSNLSSLPLPRHFLLIIQWCITHPLHLLLLHLFQVQTRTLSHSETMMTTGVSPFVPLSRRIYTPFIPFPTLLWHPFSPTPTILWYHHHSISPLYCGPSLSILFLGFLPIPFPCPGWPRLLALPFTCCMSYSL